MDAFDLFRLVLDAYSSRIIQLTSPHPMNAIQLSDALGIPIAACYRRIRTLKEAGVLKEEGKAVSIGGKLVATYRSSLEKAEVVLTDGRLRILIKANGQKTANELRLSDEPSMLHWPIDQNVAEK
jgi:DNA-binding Lrp family transcriptional regulator